MTRIVRRAATLGRTEDGATLVELIVAIAISGIIIAAITNSLIVGFRTTGETQTRLSESHNTQLVANYFPDDVASSRFAEISVVSTTASGCTGIAAGGINVVLLPFAPRPDAADPTNVAYRLEGSGTAKTLVRYQCAPGGPASRVQVASGIDTASAAKSTSGSGTTEQRTVIVSVTEISGRIFRVAGHPRNPKDIGDLPPTIPPTTAAPLPCAVVTSVVSPATRPLAATNPDTMTLSGDVALSITTEGACSSPLSVTFTPGGVGDPAKTVVLTQGSTTYDATLSATAYNWKVGSKTLVISQATGPAVGGAAPGLTVTAAPCTVQGTVSVAPNPVFLAASPAATLQNPVLVSFTSAGTCLPLQLRFSPGSAAAPPRTLTAGAGGTWSVTLAPADYAWTTGAKAVVIEQFGAVAVVNPDFAFTVNPAPCTVAAPVLGVGPYTVGSNRKLNKDVTVSVSMTSGTCTSLSVTYSKVLNGAPQTLNLTRTPANGSTWTGTISSAATWGAGTFPVTVSGATNAPFTNLVVS